MADTTASPSPPLSPAGPTGPISGGSSGTEIQQQGVTGPSGPPRIQRRRRSGGSTLQIMSGERRVKGYPISRDELFTLGGVGALASACFGVGVSLVERSFDLQANLELSRGVAPEIVARWETRETDYWIFGLVLLAFGVGAMIAGGAKILSIMRSTEHPDAP